MKFPERDALDNFFEMVDLVDDLMIGEYIGINYEGWLKIHEMGLADLIIQKAAEIHGYEIEDIVNQILDDMRKLSNDYHNYVNKHKIDNNSLPIAPDDAIPVFVEVE